MDETLTAQNWPRHSRYLPLEFRARAVTVMPGECKYSADGAVFTTLLGSCVSLCLTDPVAGAGGMNHFMLPGDCDSENLISRSARYGGYAMEFLINEVLKLGAVKERLQAKLFGGANFILDVPSVGEKNIEFARFYLASERIPIISSDLGGGCARRIYFSARDGRVMLKRLKGNARRLVERERLFSSRVNAVPSPHEITFFEGIRG